MSDPLPEELICAEELMYNGKVEEALKIITNFEEKSKLTSREQLRALLLKGNVFTLMHQFKEAIEVGERAFSISQELGLVPESIEALILKAQITHIGNPSEALDLIIKGEESLNSLENESLASITELTFNLIHTKSWIYFFKSDFDIALNLALETLTLAKKIKNNVMVGYNLGTIGSIYTGKRKIDTSLEYAKKGLKHFEKIEFQVGIAYSLLLLGTIYYLKGDLNQAIEFCKKSLSITKISDNTKVGTLSLLGGIYTSTGELNRALKYIKQSVELAEKISHYYFLMLNTRNIGEIYRMKDENDQAVKYFKQSLVLSERLGSKNNMVIPLLSLLIINLDNNSPEQAQKYLKRLENLSKQIERTLYITHGYPLGKALLLKSSSRMADQVDAVRLLNQIVDDDIIISRFHNLAIISLCDLLIEELFRYNNPDVLDDINPLILKLLSIAENQQSYSWLAEGKLLQAKLALIQMNIEEAKRLMVEAQRIADLHGLNLLASKISGEHDNLLKQVEIWEKVKKEEVSMDERIKLASVDGVLERLRGKSAVEPSELGDEEPILLLIMDSSGSTYFNHPFIANWDYSDLFSSFMSAFNTFMDEIFSKSIDRIRVGENTILINPVEPFLACYVIKGQSYPALQKLTRFTEVVRENTEIWDALNKAVKTSEMLELDKPPALKTVINEIFT
ncbi:MAG: tetratricopeptide repeat protein [Promethearchaeota archaeon]